MGKLDDFDVSEFIKSRKKYEEFVERMMEENPKNKSYRMCWRNSLYILSHGRIKIPTELIELYMNMPAPKTISRAQRKVWERRPDLRPKKEEARKLRRRLSNILTAYYSNGQMGINDYCGDLA